MDGDAAVLRRILLTRRSCRAFRTTPVEREKVAAILQAAQRTASWCNTQPWQVIVTAGEATERFRAGLAAASVEPPSLELDAPSYHGTYLERRRAVGWQLYDAVGVRRGDRDGANRQAMRNFDLFGAPHVAIVTTDRALGSYGVLDCGGYIQSFLVAAHAMGVATIAQAAIASRSAFVRSHFGLPDDRMILCGISFGFAEEAHPANGFTTDRAPLDEAASWHGEWQEN